MDLLMATGYHTDTDLENELRWFIESADGYISEDYYDREGKKEMKPVDPEGIDPTLPWYVTLGNHDVEYEGSVNNELFLGRLVGIASLEESDPSDEISLSAPDELCDQDEAIELYKISQTDPW